MWKHHAWTTGFSVTYELPDAGVEFPGWPTELTHMFGNTGLDANLETIELSNDLEKIKICADVNSRDIWNQDFEGFKFYPVGGSEIKLSPACPVADEIEIDLTGKRLIGFQVVESDNGMPGYRNIRTICPIIDEPDCADSHVYTDDFEDMEVTTSDPAESQTMIIDQMSKYYGNADG